MAFTRVVAFTLGLWTALVLLTDAEPYGRDYWLSFGAANFLSLGITLTLAEITKAIKSGKED